MSNEVKIDIEDLTALMARKRKGDRSVEARRAQEQKAVEDSQRKKERKRAELVQLNTRVRGVARRRFLTICARHADARGEPEEQGVMIERMIDFCFDKRIP